MFFDMLIKFFNFVISCLGALISAIPLPPSPFSAIDSSNVKDYFPVINYFVPVASIIVITEAWLSALAIYYVYKVALKWTKIS